MTAYFSNIPLTTLDKVVLWPGDYLKIDGDFEVESWWVFNDGNFHVFDTLEQRIVMEGGTLEVQGGIIVNKLMDISHCSPAFVTKVLNAFKKSKNKELL